jgi:Ni,Fe-hydrogenase I cytochrome b subunit
MWASSQLWHLQQRWRRVNRPRRMAHRVVWWEILVAVPVFIYVAITGRQPIEPMDALPDLSIPVTGDQQP